MTNLMKEAHFWYRGNHIGKEDVENEGDLNYICDAIMRAGFKTGLDIGQQRKRCKRILMDWCDDWVKPDEFHKKLLIGCILTLVKVGEIDNHNDDGYIILKKVGLRRIDPNPTCLRERNLAH